MSPMSHLQLSDHVVQKSPYWRANDALGHVKQRKFKFGGFFEHVRVRHLLSSMAILYHVIAQLQKAYFNDTKTNIDTGRRNIPLTQLYSFILFVFFLRQ